MSLVTRESFSEVLSEVRGRRLVVDCETTGLRPWSGRGRTGDRTCGVAVLANNQSWYFPIRHTGGENITPEQYKGLIDVISEAPQIDNHNTKFDILSLHQDGLALPKRIVDTQNAAHLFNENEAHGLKKLSDRYLEENSSAEEAALDKLMTTWGLSKDEMWRLPPGQVAPYAEQDVRLADRLDAFYREHLYDSELYDECNEFTRVLTQMEMTGIQLDLMHMQTLRSEAAREAQGLLEQIRQAAGRPINPSSPGQVSHWLMTPDATEETLSRCNNPNAKLVVKYKSWRKAIDTYYDRYLEHMDPGGVLHCNMRPTGTVTGRLATSDPNLQAVPQWSTTTEQKVKEVFVAREGRVFIEMDYKQAEMRIAAHLTGDEKQIQGFRDGVDAHTQAANEMRVERHLAKTINLAMQYGAGERKISEQLNLSLGETKRLLAKYHQTYPRLRATSRLATDLAETRGWVKTYCGRRRHFNTRDTMTKDAFQNLCQMSVADIVRRAMIRINNEVDHDTAQLLLQVHDSLLIEVRTERVKEAVEQIKSIMEDQPWCKAPLEVDTKVGPRWGGMKAYG